MWFNSSSKPWSSDFPGAANYLQEAFSDATKLPHDYLLVDLKPTTVGNVRLRTSRFSSEKTFAYLKEIWKVTTNAILNIPCFVAKNFKAGKNKLFKTQSSCIGHSETGKNVVRKADKNFIDCISLSECCKNVLKGNVPLTQKQKKYRLIRL